MCRTEGTSGPRLETCALSNHADSGVTVAELCETLDPR